MTRVGLVDESRCFTHDEAARRGVRLLRGLAYEELEPPEYCLALDKLLCGLEPDALVDVSELAPPSEAERDEGEGLLGALLDHGRLGTLSVAGLREAFLRREGVLSVRDGAWLLQVEQRTHDIVLDRLPWSFAWVKLPWMGAPLRVEW